MHQRQRKDDDDVPYVQSRVCLNRKHSVQGRKIFPALCRFAALVSRGVRLVSETTEDLSKIHRIGKLIFQKTSKQKRKMNNASFNQHHNDLEDTNCNWFS